MAAGLPPAGWYPDPTPGNSGQMYWDGEAWQATSPASPATPSPASPATPSPTGAPIEPTIVLATKGIIRGIKGMILLAVVIFAVVAIAGAIIFANSKGLQDLLNRKIEKSPSPSSGPSHSQAYDNGYYSGMQGGNARERMHQGMTANAACSEIPDEYKFSMADSMDYKHGCQDAIRDHPIQPGPNG